MNMQTLDRGTAPRFWLAGCALAIALASPFAVTKAHAVSYCVPGAGDRPEPGLQGGVLHDERTAPGGFQGHWCGMRFVGGHTLWERFAL